MPFYQHNVPESPVSLGFDPTTPRCSTPETSFTISHSYPTLQEKNSAKGNTAMNASLKVLALVLLLLKSSTLISANDTEPVLRFDTMSHAIDALTEMVLFNPSVTDFVFLVNDDFIGVSAFTLEYPNTAQKRALDMGKAPVGASWTQLRVARKGTWWGEWRPASCVHQNGHGDTPVTVTLTKAAPCKAKYAPGFNLKFGNKAASHYGYQTTGESSGMGIRTYTVPAHNYGQVWQKNFMVWQDQQHRRCRKSISEDAIWCGEWSEMIRGDLPVTNGVTIGWSTGWANMDFNYCGGGT
ncbi:hypothetical protein JCM33374_g2465 [Metschnikowia sp. JCM 33374]|nr:hypothetical protein JCM33374_g2465 [Metschnikowia sp. JCM 33374]